MPGCAAGEIFAVVTLKMMFLLSFLASRACARTPRKIHPRDFGFGPNYANFVIKIRIFSSTGTDSEGWAPAPPLFFVFCFPLPPTTPDPPGPGTFREIKNTRPSRLCGMYVSHKSTLFATVVVGDVALRRELRPKPKPVKAVYALL